MSYKKICLAAIPFILSASVVHAAEVETLSIKKQTSHYMNLQKQIIRLAVGDPTIASVIQLPGSASEFLVVTKDKPGSTSLFVWTKDGARYEYLIVVSPEDPGQAMLIQQAIGLPNVHVRMVEDRILLTGTVENQYEKNYALQTARLFVEDAGTESSILVGSGFDMKLNVQDSKSSGSEDVEVTKSESKGKIIDLLQILHPTQIRLEAQIIEITTDAAKELGLQYGTTGSGGVFSFGEDYTNHSHTTISESSADNYGNSYSNSNSSSRSSTNSSRSGSNSSDGSSSFGRTVTSTWNDMVRFGNNPIKWVTQHFAPINVTLTALVNNGKARVLSRPSVMTLSGEQATIQIGGKIPYTTKSSDSWSTQFEDYGIILQFKPVVDAQNRINSAVHAEVSNLSGMSVDSQPIIATRRADSVVTLQSGSSIVIGGLMDSSESKRVQKIPILGDIPILGEFFKHTSKSRDKRELIIVVTPYLVETTDVSQIPMSEPMRDFYNKERQEHEAKENYDFNKPNGETPDESANVEETAEPERILPPSRLPKETDKPFEK